MAGFFETQDLIQTFEPALTPDVFKRSVLIVGLGGNGTHVALAAARMGFARIVGIDCDVVSESNLSRQVLYTTQDVGRRKADAALEALQRHNLRSVIETHHLDILGERRRIGELVAAADLVFVVLDQPGTTFFAIDTCHALSKPTITGGTCVLSGLSTRVAWMGPGQRSCLNCMVPLHASMAAWVEFFRYEGGIEKQRTAAVSHLDDKVALTGGHASTYPTACLGANLMMAVAVNLLIGRIDVPRLLEFSLLGFHLDRGEIRARATCPTCSRPGSSGGPHGLGQ